MAGRDSILITCEHGGNRIPPRYRALFADFEPLLRSHRGFDPGALALARKLAAAFSAPLFASTTSRLLIDLNRSPGHPRLYSEATRSAPVPVRNEIFARHYLPYRSAIEAHVAAAVAHGQRVIHLASHSFTPVLDGVVRNADVGLLYDPSRSGEVDLCRTWQAALAALRPDLKVRRNYPYAGRSDGLTAYLRRRFPPDAYVGIELEVNQTHALRGGRGWRELQAALVESARSGVESSRL
ncbi:N-formylglutamate amidohydrolase [Thiobacillus sedimenti]|uniref:N-formylglutamate amidohydrolase n=1 Tax=Thiobacillus sedimenti TaxID=3110231 RepID=A0ABZ1CM39_9PROT|nr:N-formylglutamate amidohydrolase [Thiobacillus sp. SCUT-2]WRS40419.1 N-formylglutamate amidohydrolase [Thiobacillus sp. SCUT-2]